MDLDGDRRTDVLSGSWPGEVYWFRRQQDGMFAAGQTLKDADGKDVNVGSAASAFAVDWDNDGDLDLLVGTVLGEVHILPNESKTMTPVFGKSWQPDAGGKMLLLPGGDAAPVAADWDSDGKLDLVVGAGDGSVCWCRNRGGRAAPELDAPQELVPKSPIGWEDDDRRGPHDWGLRVKPCVTDWNGDGHPDLLLGDRCGGFRGKPEQSEAEKAEEDTSSHILPELRRKWAATFQEYRKLTADGGTSVRLAAVRQRLVRYKNEIAATQKVLERYQPGRQSHGFVWLFVRKAGTK